MMLLSYVVLVFLLFSSALAQLDPRWKLLWNDEFNSSSIDLSKWKVITVQGLSGNGEKEYYLPEQVYVENGNLVLRSDNISYVSAYPYKSGEVNSLWTGTFGRYEVRAKLPGGKGIWPAHWLLSEYLCWPIGTEFDILETIGDGHNIYGTVHFADVCYQGMANGTVYKAPFDYTQDYHVFAIEWNETSVSWFVDDVMYSTVYDSSVNKGKPFAIDTSPHYWILNTAVGGYWPGDPDATTVFPQYHLIDYVRVYGWEPCVTGCGNGCCYEPLEICICDENYQGTYCEYIAKGKTPGAQANCTAPPPPPPTPAPTPPPTPPPCNVPTVPSFKRDFTTPFNSSLDTFGNGTQGPTWEQPDNAQIVNGQLQLTATTKGCPEACFGSAYTGASYSTAPSFGSGTFTFNLKASNVLGTGLLFWLTGWDSASGWNAYQFSIASNNPTKVSSQMWWGGWENENAGEYDLGFDASQDFHTYSFEYHPAEISSFYADGNLIFTVAPGPNIEMVLKAEFFINPDYYGKFTDTVASIYVNDFAWQTNCGSLNENSIHKNPHQMSFSL